MVCAYVFSVQYDTMLALKFQVDTHQRLFFILVKSMRCSKVKTRESSKKNGFKAEKNLFEAQNLGLWVFDNVT